MPEKAINSSASGCLVLIFPLAFVMAILFVAWPAILALVVIGVGLRVWQNYQWQQWSQQVNPYFHKLIQENQGCITAMDLAMKASITGAAAQRYLETKATEFGAQRQDYQDRGQVYYFITASTLGSIFDESEPTLYENKTATQISTNSLASHLEQQQKHLEPSLEEEEPLEESTQDQEELQEAPTQAKTKKKLIQSELARRLDVHSSTIMKRRSEPYFSEWSRGRDPEGIAWKYSPKSRVFVPLDSEPS